MQTGKTGTRMNLERDEFCTTHVSCKDRGEGAEETVYGGVVVVVAGVRQAGGVSVVESRSNRVSRCTWFVLFYSIDDVFELDCGQFIE